MNILYLGAESANWVTALCEEMCQQGHTVTCVVQDEDEYDKEAEHTKHDNLDIIRVDWDSFFNTTRMKSKLVTTMAQKKFDVVFGSHAPISPVVKDLAQTYSLPWGIMLLDIPVDLMEKERFRMQQWLSWFDTMKYADVMLFNTYVARDAYHKFTNQWFDDSHVLAYATEMPEEYGMAGKDIKGDYVISISRLTPVKNCLEIAKALIYLDTNVGYIAVGRDRGELPEIKRICQENGVFFEHYENVTQKEKFTLIKNSLAVIYPQASEYIGGLSVFEGMFVGKPVICRDYPVLRDLYDDIPFYYDNDEEALAEKIAFVASLDKKYLQVRKASGNNYAKDIASFDYMAQQMVEKLERFKK